MFSSASSFKEFKRLLLKDIVFFPNINIICLYSPVTYCIELIDPSPNQVILKCLTFLSYKDSFLLPLNYYPNVIVCKNTYTGLHRQAEQADENKR